MISLIFPRITGKTKIFYVKITVGTGDNTDYYPKLKTFGKFRIGNDDDENEMIMFPGQFDFSFVMDTKAQYDIVFSELKVNEEAVIEVRYNNAAGNIRFKGKSNRISIDCKRIQRTFSMMFYDDYKKLQEKWEVPAGPTFTSQYLTINEIIYDACQLDVDDIQIVTQFSFDYDSGGGGFNFNLPELAFHKYNKLNSFVRHTPGTTDGLTWYDPAMKSQMLVGVLNNFASYAVIGLDRILYIVPKFYQGAATINIDEKFTYKDSTHSTFLKRYLGMRLIQKNVAAPFFSIWHYGTVLLKANVYPHEITNPDQVDTLWVPAAISEVDESGTDPGTVAGMQRKDSVGSEFDVFINTARYVQSDGSLSAYGGLNAHLGNIQFSILSANRSKAYAKIPGTEYNHSHFFTIDGGSEIYRPLVIEYDDMADTSDMVLVECPEVHAHTPLTGVV